MTIIGIGTQMNIVFYFPFKRVVIKMKCRADKRLLHIFQHSLVTAQCRYQCDTLTVIAGLAFS